MENDNEAKRLERQSQLSNYDLSVELNDISFKVRERVLDAGCGSGLLSRYLLENFSDRKIRLDACDFSKERVKQARKLSQELSQAESKINFFQADLEAMESKDHVYDQIFCRYVLQHFADPSSAIEELFRVLKPKGTLRIIDTDGVLFNLYCGNTELQEMLETIKKDVPVDMFIGRKLTNFLSDAGFNREDIDYRIELMDFRGEDRDEEVAQYRERLQFASPIIKGILGSQKKLDRFIELYLQEAADDLNPLFYNKFIISAQKNILRQVK